MARLSGLRLVGTLVSLVVLVGAVPGVHGTTAPSGPAATSADRPRTGGLADVRAADVRSADVRAADVRPVALSARTARRAVRAAQWTVPRRFGRTWGRPFRPGSPFNKPIGRNVRIDPRSRAMVRVFTARPHGTVQVYKDTPTIYNAYARTPRYRMNCTRDEWGTCDLEKMRVPIPRGARASHGPDANMVVIDWSTGRSYEFWQYRNDRRTASWGAVMPLNGTGTGNARSDPGRYGAVGAGISRLAGVIRAHELRKGRIPHALVGPTGFSCKDEYRYPAVKTDGWSTAHKCIPEGARVQLDPRVNCARQPGIEPWEVTVCRALKEYGWYNIDNGDWGQVGFSLQFENPRGGHDPYPGMGIEEYMPIHHIPLHRLRVLRGWHSFD